MDLNGSALRIGIPQKLLDVHLVYSPSSPESSAYDVASDGQRFLVDSMDHVPLPQPINLVLNWDTQLKKESLPTMLRPKRIRITGSSV